VNLHYLAHKVNGMRHRRISESIGHRHVRFGVDVDAVEMSFDDAVLQRVEANGDTEPGWSEEPVCGVESRVEFVQLVVDEDPQSLERSRSTVSRSTEFVSSECTVSTPLRHRHSEFNLQLHFTLYRLRGEGLVWLIGAVAAVSYLFNLAYWLQYLNKLTYNAQDFGKGRQSVKWPTG